MALIVLFVLLLMFQVWLTWYITRNIFLKKIKRKMRFTYLKRQPSGNIKISSKI